MTTLPQDEHGNLISYAWPGGYPVVYYDHDGCTLCPECAQQALRDAWELGGEADDRSLPVAYDVYYEGPDAVCEECNKAIPSAYGDPDAESEVQS